MVKISFLTNNRCQVAGLDVEHGFSCVLEVGDFKLLIDQGETDLFARNAEKMGVDLNNIKNALITHGHYDHGGGASYLSGKNIYVHEKTFQRRFKPPYMDLPKKEETLLVDNKDKNNYIEIKGNTEVSKDVLLLSGIEWLFPFEKGYYAVLENDVKDDIDDEISVIVKTETGLIVISGCAHRGICNTIEYAKKITGEQRIRAVIGGFHLRKWNEDAQMTLEYFKDNAVGELYMAHCNGDDVIERFLKEMPKVVKVVGVGMVVEFV